MTLKTYLRKTSLQTLTLILSIMLAACGGGSDSNDSAVSGGGQTPSDGSSGTEGSRSSTSVQDFWVFQRIVSVGPEGQLRDLLTPLLERVTNEPGNAVPIRGAVTFKPVQSLDAKLVDSNGRHREHIQVTPGVLRDDEKTALAVLATPDVTRGSLVSTSDRIQLDITFLESQVGGDEPVVADYYFAATTANDDAAAQTGVAGDGLTLFRSRIEAGTFAYQSTEPKASAPPALLTGNIGQTVAGSLFAKLPPKSMPLVEGLVDGLDSCEGQFGVDCVDSLLDGIAGGLGGSLEALDRNWPQNPPPVDPPSTPGFNPSEPVESAPCVANCPDGDPPGPTVCMNGCGSGGNDPHLVTFDGYAYSPQAVGEFTAVRHEPGPGGVGFELQWRFSPWRESKTISAISAVVLGIGQTRIQIDANSETPLLVNSVAQTLGSNSSGIRSDDDSILVRRVRGAYQISTGGWAFKVRVMGQAPSAWLNVIVSLPESVGTVTGMLGNANQTGRDDLTTRDGSLTLGLDPTKQELYESFVESWRIDETSSLFAYGQGQSTASFTDRSFPQAPADPNTRLSDFDPLAGLDTRQAEAVCRAAGLTDQPFHENCVRDFVLTGDLTFVAQHVAQMRAAQVARTRIFGDEIDGAQLSWWHRVEGRLAAIRGEIVGNRNIALIAAYDPDDRAWLYAFDPTSGSLLWRQPDVRVSCNAGIPARDRVVVQLDGRTATGGSDSSDDLVLVRASSGEILDRWQPSTGRLDSCRAGLLPAGDSQFYFTSRSSRRAFSVANDQITPLWQDNLSSSPLAQDRSPSAYDDAIVVGKDLFLPTIDTHDDGERRVSLYRLDGASGQVSDRLPQPLRSLTDLDVIGSGSMAVRGKSPANAATMILLTGIDSPAGSTVTAWTRTFDQSWNDSLTRDLGSRLAIAAENPGQIGMWSVVNNRGVVASIDLTTGLATWTARTSSFSNNTAISAPPGGGFVVSPFGGNWLEAFGPTGEPTWSINATPAGASFPSNFERFGDTLVVTSGAQSGTGWTIVGVGLMRE